MRKILAILSIALLLSGCSKGVSNEDYTDLQSKYDVLESEKDTIQKERDNLQSEYDSLMEEKNTIQASSNVAESDIGSRQWDNNHFTDLFVQAIKIDREHVNGYMSDDIAQIIFFAQEDARSEFDYLLGLLKDKIEIVEMVCAIEDINHLYLKLATDTGVEMFELYYDLTDNTVVSMSVGIDYINELQ